MAVDRILTVFHQEDSKSGRVGERLRARGYCLEACCPAAGDELPQKLETYAGIISFGGGMSANDEHLPFIQAELDWLPSVMAAEVPLLGICLGAQLIVKVLGGKVGPRPDGIVEIGYCPVQATPAGEALFDKVAQNKSGVRELAFYQWHREGFELAPGMVNLAQSAAYPFQAFRHGNQTYGLQFHPEATQEMIDRHLTKAAHMLCLPGAQPKEQIWQDHERSLSAVEQWLDRLFDLWLPPR